jgi:NADPH:quinone reductase-like Zn-dependent oxidoreductase
VRGHLGEVVFGCVSGCRGQAACASTALLAPKPPNLSFEEAATLPLAYVTVLSVFGDSCKVISTNAKVVILH